MQDREVELSVGDVLYVGDYAVTVIDIDGEEVSFRVDDAPSSDYALEAAGHSGVPR